MSTTLYHPDDPTISAEVIDCGEYSLLRYNDGTEVKAYGFGAMKDIPLDLDPRIDLTKPIYAQAMKLWRSDEKAERKVVTGEAA